MFGTLILYDELGLVALRFSADYCFSLKTTFQWEIKKKSCRDNKKVYETPRFHIKHYWSPTDYKI